MSQSEALNFSSQFFYGRFFFFLQGGEGVKKTFLNSVFKFEKKMTSNIKFWFTKKTSDNFDIIMNQSWTQILKSLN